ncbi:MAG TPA: PEGA domain-containing protein [Polyangiaceae bacterium]|nr:PEGA domain-containing protein [Polyangiaceae bacterium]
MPSALSTQLTSARFASKSFGVSWLLGIVLLLPSLARAQPEPPKRGRGDDACAAAKTLMAEGNALYVNRDFEGAHQKFLEAWALKQHAAIASNLVETEMKLGRYAEAADRLRDLLDSVPVDDKEERTALMTQLDECRHHLVALQIAVNVDGATVKVDGKTVGTSPLGREVLVEPGRASVVAELDGYVSEAFLMTDGAAGESRSIHLSVTPKIERPAPTAKSSRSPHCRRNPLPNRVGSRHGQLCFCRGPR